MTASTTETTITLNRQDILIAHLSTAAICLHVLESAWPLQIPGAKPAWANLVAMLTLRRYGWVTTAHVMIFRVVGGSLAVGLFLSPTFMLSLAGTIASAALLGLVAAGHLLKWFSMLGVSLLSAMAHILGQVTAVRLLFITDDSLWQLLPFFLSLALVTGFINGLIANHLWNTALPDE